MSQKVLVRRMLEQRGEQGVTAFELIYTHGITRAAAIVFDLKAEGLDIVTFDDGPIALKRRTSRYVLRSAIRPVPLRRVPPPEPESLSVAPPQPVAFVCGCVREGRSWSVRCQRHQPRETTNA